MHYYISNIYVCMISCDHKPNVFGRALEQIQADPPHSEIYTPCTQRDNHLMDCTTRPLSVNHNWHLLLQYLYCVSLSCELKQKFIAKLCTGSRAVKVILDISGSPIENQWDSWEKSWVTWELCGSRPQLLAIVSELTHFPLVPNLCVAYSAPSHYLNQW